MGMSIYVVTTGTVRHSIQKFSCFPGRANMLLYAYISYAILTVITILVIISRKVSGYYIL